MNFSIEGIENVVDKLTQYASGDKIERTQWQTVLLQQGD